ncbi:hypothetical protein D3C76_1277330 [compost metagenome]
MSLRFRFQSPGRPRQSRLVESNHGDLGLIPVPWKTGIARGRTEFLIEKSLHGLDRFFGDLGMRKGNFSQLQVQQIPGMDDTRTEIFDIPVRRPFGGRLQRHLEQPLDRNASLPRLCDHGIPPMMGQPQRCDTGDHGCSEGCALTTAHD